MRTLFLLIVFLCIGANSLAQENSHNKKLHIPEKGFVLQDSLRKPTLKNQDNLAGIYKFKHSKIKRALAFRTKRGRSKLA